MKKSNSQYKQQIFICCNEKADGSGCATLGAAALREDLKNLVREKGLNEEIRVNKAGCLNYCQEGIAAVIYPEGKTLTEINLLDTERLLDELLQEKN